MSWIQLVFLSLLVTVLVLTESSGVDGAAVRDEDKGAGPRAQLPTAERHASRSRQRRVFMPEADATNFFKRRSRRGAKYDAEIIAEQRVRMAADERRREYNDEQRTEFENYVEEERDEQYERSRERTEQYREYTYDGLYPRYDHRPY